MAWNALQPKLVDKPAREFDREFKLKPLLENFIKLKTRKEIEDAHVNEKKVLTQLLHSFQKSHYEECLLAFKKFALAFNKALDIQIDAIQAIQEDYEYEKRSLNSNHLEHLHISDQLFDFLQFKCHEIFNAYTADVATLKKYYLVREICVVNEAKDQESKMRDLSYQQNIMDHNIQQETQSQFKSICVYEEFQKHKEVEHIYEKYDVCIENIWEMLRDCILSYEQSAQSEREIFEECRNRHEMCVQRLTKVKCNIQPVSVEVSTLCEKVAETKKQLEFFKIKTKQEQKEKVNELWHAERNSRVSQGPSLHKLVAESEIFLSKLRERTKKAYKVLKLKDFCDKLETLYENAVLENSLFLLEEVQKQINDDEATVKQTFEFEDLCLQMERLHQKTSHVVLQNLSIQHEIRKVELDNRTIRSDMKQYLNCIAAGKCKRLSEKPILVQEARLIN